MTDDRRRDFARQMAFYATLAANYRPPLVALHAATESRCESTAAHRAVLALLDDK
ncbi:hypothetical protein ACIBKZ_15700 [Streptomyces sp. NPDC050421]|uniref:hypothetical protein n=1 Tax=Streptomyces sp. NPDC050421 TaxID=3365613 RepID=UPI0037A634EE